MVDYQIDRGDGGISFRELRKEFNSIPAMPDFMREVTDLLFFISYATMII